MLTFEIADVWAKINEIEKSCEEAFKLKTPHLAPKDPNRDIDLLHPKYHPPKKGFSTIEGQARMLHDLASIELQAMELGVRTLSEFPDAPEGFKEELVAVTVSEAQHLRMCLEAIESLGFKWGDWPVHAALWYAVAPEDTLLDRILIVHRYLEGSGLDAGDTLIRRLEGTSGKETIQKIVKQINFEEIGHVDFGSRWYREICLQNKINPNEDFPKRMDELRYRLPKRVEPINRILRGKAGFTDEEIQYYENLRLDFINPLSSLSQR
ncbi:MULTISPECIES: DUF455 family protein [unclassified Bdellovibrio]|jgi:uncharacterized ferritin-like protein (DUF455 family)|uniref:DUF455 family protein n=1 Tax=unclassified Bdellovibrio TaxID=2633795 RepID=UPI00115793A4|nr:MULTISPECIES: DUF455 family protein [unclassified Bdellovibrio]QDK45548.1 DUF455 domain-containing protein [Bdellovibrio sp. ZAP7]QLY23795.1 DUF455 family protein [Bdellovibrio sp. KM01]